MVQRQITRRDFGHLLTSGALFALITSEGEAKELAQEHAGFAFGVIADAQYCDAEPAGTRHYRASPKKLSECVNVLNQLNLAFVIQLGDFIDRDLQSCEVLLPIFNRLKAPGYHVLGNHDFVVTADQVTDIAAMLGMQDRYYQFRTHGWRFVVLDGNDLSLIARPKGSPEYECALSLYTALKEQDAPHAQTWNGGIGEIQLKWLERQLTEADGAHERVVVFCHFPVYPANPHNLWNAMEVRQVLDAHPCVAAFMNGHNHDGNYGEHHGIHYVTFPGMVETEESTAFAAVNVCAGCLQVTGYGRTPHRSLKIRE
ncbi:MAG: metallophosphoesterase [Pirellulaceae bacterium]